MKTSSVTYLIILTLLLVTVTIFAALDFAFGVIFYLTVVGQVALVFVVVKVLKDNYTTNKTFGDFYEDFPIEKEDRLH
ncbi:hypothetical protein K8089_14060 [Aequorivita sp. F47161]|uniref:Uncharacterized protein n=1 Tax=Aequorivita vitellina TaxID=2874475 RepID=A0A9X1QYF4_9FLAO|nr:hypothetical protein [Aequorivita vitellina]MCG2420151.1 hypothetical protein [Aequorivita vitellina]